MTKVSPLTLAWFIVLCNIVTGTILCEDANDEDFCVDLREERNQNCLWNTTVDECQTVNCGLVDDEDTCESPPWSTEFYCQWDVFEDTRLGGLLNPPSGDLELCYTVCPLNLDIVFIVDVSQSVVTTNPNNAVIFGDFVETVMDTWWKMQDQVNRKTAFGMVSFSTDVDTQFDLNTDWDLDEYLDYVDDFFKEDNFGGQTNTLGAFWESLDVFDGSDHYNDTHWQRMAILITDGDPTIAPKGASAGPNPCEPVYDINGSYARRGIYLYAALVSPATTVFVECFDPSRSLIRQVGNFSGLGAEIGRIVGQYRCPFETEDPTEYPTENPTIDPTENPTEMPTENPTENPTEMPSEQPTENPTEVPSEDPTTDPTKDPTEEPSHRAWWTARPTHRQWWSEEEPFDYDYDFDFDSGVDRYDHHGFGQHFMDPFEYYRPYEDMHHYNNNNNNGNKKKKKKGKKKKNKDNDKKRKKKKKKKKKKNKKKNGWNSDSSDSSDSSDNKKNKNKNKRKRGYYKH